MQMHAIAMAEVDSNDVKASQEGTLTWMEMLPPSMNTGVGTTHATD
jgi:hypothetical protein